MKNSQPVLAKINVVARHFDETLGFYRLLGLDMPEPMNQPEGALHAEANGNSGIAFALDNDVLANLYHSGRRLRLGGSSVLMTATFSSRQAVDDTYAKLVAAGHTPRQAPYDAFWGARYAIVADPEGNDVGLMSPVSTEHQSWPPIEAPAT